MSLAYWSTTASGLELDSISLVVQEQVFDAIPRLLDGASVQDRSDHDGPDPAVTRGRLPEQRRPIASIVLLIKLLLLWRSLTDRRFFHAAVELLPTVVGGSGYLHGSANICNGLSLVEQLLRTPELADDLYS